MTIASRNRKAVLFFLLFAILAAPWVSAAGTAEADIQPAASPLGGLFDRFWSFLTSTWAETGCMIDPDGPCVPEPRQQVDSDTGCHIDPDGRFCV